MLLPHFDIPGPSLVMAGFAKSVEVYAFFQLVWCTSLCIIWVNSHTCLLECFDARSRVAVTCVKDLMRPTNLVLLGVIGYFIRDWTHLQFVSGALCCIPLFMWHYLPESVRWLAQNHR